MPVRKRLLLMIVICLLLTGCGGAAPGTNTAGSQSGAVQPGTSVPAESDTTTAPVEQTEPAAVVRPLPDTTMEQLTDAILSVSLAEGDVYLDDTGKLQMKVKIYACDAYDAAQVTRLKVGDTLVTHGGEVSVSSVACSENGSLYINEGLQLTPGTGGIFHAVGADGGEDWYEIGQATLRVSADFTGYDHADPKVGEDIFYAGDFLGGAVTDYSFTPDNTTIRVEDGQVVELNRIYIP
jgi:hypothetical protein